ASTGSSAREEANRTPTREAAPVWVLARRALPRLSFRAPSGVYNLRPRRIIFAMLHQLILAGGSGTRFWPKSRAALPKQLLSLDGGPTLLEKTAARLEGAVLPERIFVVTTAPQAPRVRERLPK